jgi:adenylate cyclase
MSGSASTERFEQALSAFLRAEFGASVGAVAGFLDILIEDAQRTGAADFLPDLERMRLAAEELSALIARIAELPREALDEAEERRLRHDLRTPLGAIKGYGELLVEEAREGGREELLPDLAKIVSLVERLLGEIDRFVLRSDAAAAAAPSEAVTSALLAIKPLEGSDPLDRCAAASRVLVVDDNLSNRDLLTRWLAHAGHRAQSAQSGEEALRLVESAEFDLVLLDLMMPGLSGFEVLCRLKASERTRHLPVIMISALGEIASTVRCIEAGAEDYLAKPFNPVLLRARINASLEKKHLRDREEAIREELRLEKERFETLLLNILPRPIVERLRRGEKVIADRVADATILFSDFVDFTALASRLSPEETVDLLGLVFARFDALAARRGLEKIKTIGDGYMVAGGLPEHRADHAAAIAKMALEMREIAAATAEEKGWPLRLRIGLHTGTLVAGVIGTHKFVYDVWGDTVNTAKRMESYGLPDRIHVSAATRGVLGDAFLFEPRGPLEIKGKGLMETFFLERLR